MSRQVTGTIIKQQLCSREPYEGQSRYSINSTRSEKYLKITLQDESGMKYYFNTPAATQTVTVAPGCAVVIFRIENGAAQWMSESGNDQNNLEHSAIAVPGKKNTNKIKPLTKEGDEITITGRFTEKVSKYGNKYTTATHVKRI